MVTLTNRLNLPQQLVDACLVDSHKVAGDLSVSQLIEAPRIILLKRQNNTTEDVADRMYMLMGTALHHILERANMSNVLKRAYVTVRDHLTENAKKIADEKKRTGMEKVVGYLSKVIVYFFPDLENRFLYEVTQRMQIGDKVLYGTPDLFDKTKGILYDYKFCSVYSYIYPESRHKWEVQTNVYAELLRNAGYDVKEIRIVAFFRDWSENNFSKKKDYPSSQVIEIIIKLRTPVEMANYIGKRMKMHQEAEETGILPFCTGQERWASADDYAVKTPGVKKAVRVVPTKAEAEAWMSANTHKYDEAYIVYRPGVSKKCESYCSVKEFCTQHKAELEARRIASDSE